MQDCSFGDPACFVAMVSLMFRKVKLPKKSIHPKKTSGKGQQQQKKGWQSTSEIRERRKDETQISICCKTTLLQPENSSNIVCVCVQSIVRKLGAQVDAQGVFGQLARLKGSHVGIPARRANLKSTPPPREKTHRHQKSLYNAPTSHSVDPSSTSTTLKHPLCDTTSLADEVKTGMLICTNGVFTYQVVDMLCSCNSRGAPQLKPEGRNARGGTQLWAPEVLKPLSGLQTQALTGPLGGETLRAWKKLEVWEMSPNSRLPPARDLSLTFWDFGRGWGRATPIARQRRFS